MFSRIVSVAPRTRAGGCRKARHRARNVQEEVRIRTGSRRDADRTVEAKARDRIRISIAETQELARLKRRIRDAHLVNAAVKLAVAMSTVLHRIAANVERMGFRTLLRRIVGDVRRLHTRLEGELVVNIELNLVRPFLIDERHVMPAAVRDIDALSIRAAMGALVAVLRTKRKLAV